MASLSEQVTEAWKAALRSGDTTRRDTFSMLRAAIKNAEIENRTTAGGAATLDDAATLRVIEREAKKRREAIDEFARAERPDRAAAEEAELAVLQEFLPEPLTAAETERLVHEAIDAAGADKVADMGRVMQVLMPRLGGRADGKQVSALVRQVLSGAAARG